MFLVGILLPDLIRIIRDYVSNQIIESGLGAQIHDHGVRFLGSYDYINYTRLVTEKVTSSGGDSPNYAFQFWLREPFKVRVLYNTVYGVGICTAEELSRGYHHVTELTFRDGPYKNFTEMFYALVNPDDFLIKNGWIGPVTIRDVITIYGTPIRPGPIKGPNRWISYRFRELHVAK
jgi:hypothetical protein